MRKKYLKLVSISSVIIYSLILSLVLFTDYTNANNIIIKSDRKEISYQDIENRILEEQWLSYVQNIANETLIFSEAEELGLLPVSEDQIMSEAHLLSSSTNNSYNLNDIKVTRLLQERILVKKIAEKFTVTDADLERFLGKNKGSNKNIFVATYYEDKHDIVGNVYRDLIKGLDEESVEKKYNMTFKQIELNPNDFTELDPLLLKKGDIKHVHTNDKHAIIVIKEIKKTQLQNIDQDRKLLLQGYLNEHLQREKTEVIGFLRNKYPIQIKKYPFQPEK